MKLPLILSVAVLSATVVLAEDQNQPMTDQQFIQKAANGSQMEIEMGRMATQKASDPQVKQFGQRLVDDHTRASNELKPIAQRLGVSLDDKSAKHEGKDYNRSDRADARAQNENKDKSAHHASKGDKGHHEKLNALSGSQFDQEFIKMAVKHHRKDVAQFQKASQNAQDQEVKAFAARTLPVLQQHLQQAQQLAQSRNITITEASGAEAEYDAESTSDSSTSGAVNSDSSIKESSGAATDSSIQQDNSSLNSAEQSTSTSVNESSTSTSVDANATTDNSSSPDRAQSSTTINEPAGASSELPSGLNSSNPQDQNLSGTSSRPSEPQRNQEANKKASGSSEVEIQAEAEADSDDR